MPIALGGNIFAKEGCCNAGHQHAAKQPEYGNTCGMMLVRCRLRIGLLAQLLCLNLDIAYKRKNTR